jgi:DNA helicase-2/ATP-dependent DNA helicase PcrA
MLEEERRLMYVAMTRAQQQLYLSSARYRRRFGGGPPEPGVRSRFLKEVPPALLERLSPPRGIESVHSEVNLTAEQSEVRETVRKNLFTGKTYNSLENIQQFFAERGMPVPRGLDAARPKEPAPAKPAARPASGAAGGSRKRFSAGTTIEHPKYGRGTILRREGDGEDAKLTISFPGHGLKKILERFLGS